MRQEAFRDLSIAVLLPCYNEAQTIGDTVAAFREVPLLYVADGHHRSASASVVPVRRA